MFVADCNRPPIDRQSIGVSMQRDSQLIIEVD